MKTFSTTRLAALVVGLSLLGAVPAHAADKASDGDEELQSRTGKQIKLRGFDEQMSQNEQMLVMAEQKRMESIEKLKGLLTHGVRDDTKAEMMLRLADLYFQQGRYLYLREMASFDKQYDTCFNQPGCNPEGLKPDNSGSREWQEKSIKLYDGILRNYPRYERSDQATFYLGSALKDLGQEQEAAEAFKQLVKMYPQSDFIADAWVLIGEYYFDVENNAFGALKAYLNASRYTDSPKYAYSLYKLGWCYYNVGEYENAIATMKKVVDYSLANADQSQSNMQLQDEALKDLVRFFADADQMNEAIEYFTKLGRTDLIRTTLKRLAGMFCEQGKFDRCVEMYRRLILDQPTAKDNPEYQTEIISAYKKMGQREKVLDEINRLRADYNSESAWAKANAADPTAVAEAQTKIEAQLRGIAADYHQTARQYEKSRHPDTMQVYQLAKTAYQTYLDLFPTNEHSYEVRYAYGELLYKLKDFAGAFEQYMKVVDIDPKGKHSRFCAESAIFAAEEQIKVEGGAAGSGRVTAKPTKDVQPQSLSDWEQRFVDACNKYATLYPEDKRVKDVIYKSAYLLYNKYRFEEASKQFQAVIAMDPRSKEAELGANLILDALNIKENWDSLRQTAKAFYDQQGLGSPTFKKDVYDIYMNSSFKLIEISFEKDKDFGKAADGFVAFYEEFPESAIAAQALNNAAAYYAKAGRPADSVKVRHILIDDPKFGPKTKYYYDQIGFLAYDYEQVADYANAAFYYEKFWTLTPAEKAKAGDDATKLAAMNKTAGDAIYSAAVFRKGLGEADKAIEDYNAFVDGNPDDERVPDVKIRVGRIYEENERWQDAANVYQAFYKSPPKGSPVDYAYFARLHYGQAMDKLGKRRERDAIYEDTVKLYQKSGTEKGPQTEYVAEMMYDLAQPKLDKYMELRISGAGKGASQKAEDKALAASLTKKTKALVDVEKAFTDVVATGAGEWGLASLVSLGKVYENMADSFVNSDKPSYLTPDQVEIYSMQLADRAYVMDEKAVNAYKLALDKSFELTLYNENTAYATRQLGELRPDDYPGLTEELLQPRYTSSKSTQKFSFETSL
ncbi:MAG: tetratricopeptide repeat protein [Myxococcota bacterium]